MIGTKPYPPQRFVGASFLCFVTACLAACSGSSSGGPANDALPTIVTASFSGSSSTPAAGDTLVLAFSEAVTLVAGALLTDEDLTLSGGATLGDVTAAPTTIGSNSISVVLGAGVAIVPNTTTIALGEMNDAIRDGNGQLGNGGTPVTIGSSDGSPPIIANVTIAGIDAELNGTGAAGGTLQLPANGWTIDLTYSDNTGVATAQTQITASITVFTGSGPQSAGTNLVPFLTEVSASNTGASYQVPSAVTVPNGPITLTCTIVDVSGLASTQSTFDASVRAFSDPLQPFETNVNASQVWFLDFDRDLESFTTSAAGLGVQVNQVNGANGTSDFEDLLLILGLTSTTPLANVQGSLNSNEVVLDRFKTELLEDLATLYSGANITFTLTQPAGTFSSSSVPYNSFGYSQISIAGAASDPGVLGLAIFDPSNTTQNDNTQDDFQTKRLGVFLHTIIDDGMQAPSATLFRLTYDPFAPSLSGTPIGNDVPDDAARLNGTLPGTRQTAIDTAISDLARFTALVTAHECGHSHGLVENGAMPIGLYGDDDTNFPGSQDGHIRNTSLFPVGSTNVMSPSLSYTTATSPSSVFNSLNLAYLREQVFYGN